MLDLLFVLIAFVREHWRCGELDGGVEGERVWRSGDCGGGIAHPVGPAERNRPS